MPRVCGRWLNCGHESVQGCCDKSPTQVTDRAMAMRTGSESRRMIRTLRPPSSRTKSRRPRPSRIVAGLLLGVANVVLAGCGSTSPSQTESTSTTTTVASTPTTTQPTGPAEMALAAYRGMWADMVIASRTSDYQSPLLPQHATGDALSVLVQGLAKNQEEDVVTKGKPSLHPEITSLTSSTSPMQAAITDCVDDTHWLEYKTTGGLLNSVPGGRHATTAIVKIVGTTWKVTNLAVQAVGTC
jgi:hypothetical protein